MSGLEVVGLIAGITSAFVGAKSYLLARKKREEVKAKRQEAEALRTSLVRGKTEVQEEYDSDFARLGAPFARGDEIARRDLTTTLLRMQQQFITTLQAMVIGELNIDYNLLLGVSSDSRRDAVSALSEQFQRLSIAAPIRTLTELNPRKMPSDQQQNPGFCWNAWYMQHDGLLLACKSPSVSSPKNLVMGTWARK
ncbi:hypothetical protein MMC12_007284 [Toensbergia leucococca]|nr:hypothetical protein [Toensbergia leucococca]